MATAIELGPVATMLMAGAAPIQAYLHSKAPWPCVCNRCGRVVTPSLNNVRNGSGPCIHCAKGRTVDARAARVLMCASGVVPIGEYPGATTPWPSTCTTCFRLVKPTYTQVRTTRSGCSYCSGRSVDELDAFATMEAAGLSPLAMYPGSKKPWPCVCNTCGDLVAPRYNGISNGQGGCRKCGHALGTLKRRHEETTAIRIAREAGYQPMAPYVRSNDHWPMIHIDCGTLTTSMTLARIVDGQKCTTCWGKRVGEKPRLLYLIANESINTAKIGVTYAHTTRLQQWQSAGFAVVGTWECETARIAQRIEEAVKARWRFDLRLPFGCSPYDLSGLAGWTETAPLSALSLDDERAFIDRLAVA